MSTIACQFRCMRGFANKGQDVSRASVTGIVRSVHYTGWQLQNGQLSTALGSCVYSRAADPFIQLWFTMLAKAESYLCRRERISCKNLALTSCTPASQKKLSFFTCGEVKECIIGYGYWRSRHLKAIIRTLIILSFVTICTDQSPHAKIKITWQSLTKMPVKKHVVLKLFAFKAL